MTEIHLTAYESSAIAGADLLADDELQDRLAELLRLVLRTPPQHHDYRRNLGDLAAVAMILARREPTWTRREGYES